MNMKKRIPKFRNVKEEAQFGDTHDSTDYLDEFDEDTETIFVRPENGIVELKTKLWKKLVQEAKRRHMTPASLIDKWLQEKLVGSK